MMMMVKDLRVLAGLLTGHADLNWHLTLMQVRNDEICPLCQEAEETRQHMYTALIISALKF